MTTFWGFLDDDNKGMAGKSIRGEDSWWTFEGKRRPRGGGSSASSSD